MKIEIHETERSIDLCFIFRVIQLAFGKLREKWIKIVDAKKTPKGTTKIQK